MCHAQLQSPNFLAFLLHVDQDLAAQTHAAGCRCGGVLHRANFPRKPRGCLKEAMDSYSSRFSFCCNLCRKRATSMSVRFLGQRVYLAAVVVLESSRRTGKTAAAAHLSATLGVPVRTFERWRQWWRTDFLLTPFWQAVRGRFMPPVVADQLPAGLQERFVANLPADQLTMLLRFLTPLSVRAASTFGEGR